MTLRTLSAPVVEFVDIASPWPGSAQDIVNPLCILCDTGEVQLLYSSTLPAGKGDKRLRFCCTSNSYGVHDDIWRCQKCGLVFMTPSCSEQALLEQYAAIQDPMYVAEREGRVLTFRQHLQPIKRMVGPGPWRLLDVGCHIGVFVELAQAEGWDAWGVDPSLWAADYAQQRGLQVSPTTVAGAGFAEASFDMVTLWDVIEHMADPISELREIHRVLRSGGLLVIHTINIESLFARLMGSKWPWLMEMHRLYYSPRTLDLLLKKTGFDQFETRNQGRYLRLGYLLTRFAPYVPRLSRLLIRVVNSLHINATPIPINLGDLFTSFSRQSSEPGQEVTL